MPAVVEPGAPQRTRGGRQHATTRMRQLAKGTVQPPVCSAALSLQDSCGGSAGKAYARGRARPQRPCLHG
eukprot:365934-Chlamydomonas_euryale.AAC.10